MLRIYEARQYQFRVRKLWAFPCARQIHWKAASVPGKRLCQGNRLQWHSHQPIPLDADMKLRSLLAEIFRKPRADLREVAQRSGQMIAQMPLRAIGVAGGDGGCDQLVVAHDVLRLAR